MHLLHMMDPQRRQWCRLFRMLNLFPQSGQNGTSESFTHDTTDFSMAIKKKDECSLIYNTKYINHNHTQSGESDV